MIYCLNIYVYILEVFYILVCWKTETSLACNPCKIRWNHLILRCWTVSVSYYQRSQMWGQVWWAIRNSWNCRAYSIEWSSTSYTGSLHSHKGSPFPISDLGQGQRMHEGRVTCAKFSYLFRWCVRHFGWVIRKIIRTIHLWAFDLGNVEIFWAPSAATIMEKQRFCQGFGRMSIYLTYWSWDLMGFVDSAKPLHTYG